MQSAEVGQQYMRSIDLKKVKLSTATYDAHYIVVVEAHMINCDIHNNIVFSWILYEME